MTARRVLSVGQCAADHGSISWTLQRAFDAEVVPAASTDEALLKLRQGPYDLVLVNRVFDRDGSPGLDLIAALKADEAVRQVPVMLVSNYEDAQAQAVQAGAVPGFGKSALGQPQMLERVSAFLATKQTPPSP
jgi:CheY-like chemotaxis protein